MKTLEDNFAYIVSQANAITRDVNRSLDRYEEREDAVCPTERILDMGVLIASLERGRTMAWELASRVPSPNQVPAELADSVAEITNALFRFIESCERRETGIGEMVLGSGHSLTV
jgi:hypothetical protein